MKPTKLLDLPDELLFHILSHFPYPGLVSTRAPLAFPVALTCTRLLAIYRRTLRTLDCFFPHQETDLVRIKIYASHLLALVRLAGPQLKEFRLYGQIPPAPILHALTLHSPYLCALTFEDIGPIPKQYPLASLDFLRVDKPGPVFAHLHTAARLHELRLDNLDARAWKQAAKALPSVASHLRYLHLTFISTSNPRWRNYAAVAAFFKGRVASDFPVLRELELMQHAVGPHVTSRLPDDVIDRLAAEVADGGHGRIPTVRFFALRDDVEQCVSMFANVGAMLEVTIFGQRIFLK